MDDKEKKETAPAEETAEQVEKTETPKEETKSKKEDKKAKKEKKAEEKKAVEPDLKAEPDGANDRYLRLLAEYDNYRTRSIKADTGSKFLPVYDNLRRALAQETGDEAYRKGVEMIMTQFEQTLEKLGVTKIKSLGQTFDPNRHNAVMHVDDEEKGENEIVEVFQEGFQIGDKIIRFAMVKVAN